MSEPAPEPQLPLAPAEHTPLGSRPAKELVVPKRDESLPQTTIEVDPEASFEDLQKRFAAARLNREVLPCGNTELKLLYRKLKYGQFRNAIGEKAMGKWAAEVPGDPTPLIALADIEIERAWVARGSGLAYTVNAEQFEKFRTRLQTAHQYLLRGLELEKNDPELYSLLITVGLGLPIARDQVDAWAAAGSKAFPTYFDLYSDMGNYLLPKWHGDQEDLPRYAESLLQSVGGDDGLEAFTRVLMNAAEFDEYLIFHSGLKPQDVLRGAKLMHQRYPLVEPHYDYYAYVALMNLDRDFARVLLPKMLERERQGLINARIWTDVKQFDKFVTFCTRPAAVDAPDKFFFPNYTFAGSVTFADSGQGMQIIAASLQEPVRLCIWNLDDLTKPFGYLPLPGTQSKYELSSDRLGRYVLAFTRQQQPHAIIYDWSGAREPLMIPVSGAPHDCEISADGSRVAMLYDRYAEIWDVVSGEKLRKIEPVRHMSTGYFRRTLSVDGSLLATGGAGVVELWDTNTVKQLHRFDPGAHLNGGAGSVKAALGFTLDHQMIGGTAIMLKENEKERLAFHITRHAAPHYGVKDAIEVPGFLGMVASYSDRYLAAGCKHPQYRDRYVTKIIDMRSGKAIRTLDCHRDNLWSAAFSPDGRWLATLDSLSAVHLWAVPQE